MYHDVRDHESFNHLPLSSTWLASPHIIHRQSLQYHHWLTTPLELEALAAEILGGTAAQQAIMP